MLRTILRAVALAAAVLASVPALAQEKLPDIRVRYGDLDLSDAADVRTFDRRLILAVRAACPNDNGVRALSLLRKIAACRAAKGSEVAPQRDTALAAAKSRNASFATAQ